MRIFIFFLIINTWNVYCADSIPNTITKKLYSLNVEEQLKFLASESWKTREADTDLALVLAKKGLEIAQEHNANHHIAVLNAYIGVYYLHYYYLPRESLPYFHLSLEVALEHNDSIQVAYAYNNLANAFLKIYNIPFALEYTNLSIQLFEEMNHQKGIAYGYINLGDIYRVDKKYEQSLASFQKSLDINTQLKDADGIAYSLLEIGRSFVYLNQLDVAANYLSQSLKMHEKSGNLVYQAFCYDAFGQIHYKKNDISKALDFYLKALELNKKRNYRLGIISNNIGIALCYSKQKKASIGEKYIREAEIMAENLALPNKLTEVYHAYVAFYKNDSTFQMPSDRLLKFVNTYDTMMTNLMVDTFKETGLRIKTETKLNVATTNLENQQRQKIYLYVIIVLFFSMLFIIYWRYRVHLKLNKELQKTVKEKEKFFSVITHDLKSPFNSILGFSKLLVDKVHMNELHNVSKYAEIIIKSSSNAMELLQNLIDWSNAETGRMKFDPQDIELTQLFTETESLLSSSFQLKGITVVKNFPISAKVHADKAMISTVIRNLLSNAIKFTPKNGCIQLSIETIKNELQIAIQDNGVGIAQETQLKLFHFSESISTLGTENEKGTGLGLLLCKEFVEKHQGKIWVESNEGQGSTFYVTLPL